MKGKKIVGMCLGAVLAFGSAFGMAGCNNESQKPNNIDDDIFAVYGMYVANAESKNEEPMTYDEWYANLLATAKGEKGDNGKDGVTPSIGEDGYWYFGDQKTEYKATGTDGENGQNGITPSIGEDGYWYFGDQKTEYKAVGENGQQGQRGNRITCGEGYPTIHEDDILGDIYIDTTTWNFYVLSPNPDLPSSMLWIRQGCIKGEQGEKGEKGDSGVVEESVDPREEQNVNLVAGASQSISVQGLTGAQVVIMDLGETKLTTGRIQMNFADDTKLSEIVFSETRTNTANNGHNIYFGYIFVPEAKTKVNVTAIGEDVKATVKFEEYKVPTLSLDGGPIEVCLNAYGTDESNRIKFLVAPGIQSGKVKITVGTHSSNTEALYYLCIGKDKTGVRITKSHGNPADYTFDPNNYESGDTFGSLIYSRENSLTSYPVTLTMTK